MDTQIDTIITSERARQRRGWAPLALLGAGVLLLGAIFGSAATSKGWFNGNGSRVPIYISSDAKVNENVTINGGFSAIAKVVTPAVVTVNIRSRASQQRSPFFTDPFRDFFDGPDDEDTPRRRVPTPPQSKENKGPLVRSGTGSGVIVSPDGYILTNNHVVEGSEKIEVELTDRRKFEAKVIGTDALSDVALIKIEGTGFPVVPFGDSNQMQIGDIVLAIGNPLDIGQTVTMGIISAKGRSTSRGANPQSQPYQDFLQTDAAINRGNSGGALVNLRGELVGIPSQILAGSAGGSIGIGFAIPSMMARNVMDQLLRSGKVRRGKLGVVVGEVTPALAEQFNFRGNGGALVQDVEKGLPADQAGVHPGDVITEFQGQRIAESSQLRNLTSQTTPGTAVKLKIWRDGSERELSVRLAEVNPETTSANGPITPESGAAVDGLLSGVRVENLTAENSRALRLPDNARGVIVAEVSPDSNAAASGLRRGLVIEEVARQPVTSISDFNAAMQKLGNKKSVLLRVRDGGGARFLIVESQE